MKDFILRRYTGDFLLLTQNCGVSKEIVVYCFNIRTFNIGSFAYTKACILILFKDEESIWELKFFN